MPANALHAFKMTHGLSFETIEEALLSLMDRYPNNAWLISSLCRKIFQNQEIRDTHKKALKDIVSQLNKPRGWIYYELRFQKLDGILYNMNSKESRIVSDDYLIRSTSERKYRQLLKDELDLERKSLGSRTTNSKDLNQQPQQVNNGHRSIHAMNQNSASIEIINNLVQKLDDL